MLLVPKAAWIGVETLRRRRYQSERLASFPDQMSLALRDCAFLLITEPEPDRQ
jgi:hypothetical protein